MRRSENRTILRMAGLAAVAIVIVVGFFAFGKSDKSAVSTSEIESGISFLKKQESGDVSAVQSEIMDIQKKKEELIRAQKRKQFEDGQIDVWSLFKNYVILGDSRSEGFIDFKYLSSDRVLASKGDNIDSIPAHIDQIRKLNPSQIFVCYGMNDLTNNVGGSVDGWIAKYEDYINQLKQAVPGAEIFINDIMAPQEAAYAVSGNLAYFSQYNDKLRTLCRKIGVHYIDTSGTTAEHADLYAPDGIHFNYEFYPYWAAAMQYTAMGGDEEAGEERAEERNAEDEETTDSGDREMTDSEDEEE